MRVTLANGGSQIDPIQIQNRVPVTARSCCSSCAAGAVARSSRTACASSCATARWPPARACRPRARWPPISRSPAGWWSTPTRSCSPRATSSPASGARHVRRRRRRLAADGAAAGAARGRCSSTSSPARPTSRRSRGALWSRRAARRPARGARERVRLPGRARRARAARASSRAYLRRVRGVVAEPDAIVICAGATQGLALLGRALRAQRHARDRRRGPGPAAAPRGARLRGPRRARRARRRARRSIVDALERAGRCSPRPPTSARPGVVLSPAAPRRADRVGARGRPRDRGRLRRRVPLRPRAARSAAGARARARRLPGHGHPRRSLPGCAWAGWCCPAR